MKEAGHPGGERHSDRANVGDVHRRVSSIKNFDDRGV